MNIRNIVGLALGLAIGAVCRWLAIPAPSPPAIPGAILVIAMTTGYLIADRLLQRPEFRDRAARGGKPNATSPPPRQKTL